MRYSHPLSLLICILLFSACQTKTGSAGQPLTAGQQVMQQALENEYASYLALSCSLEEIHALMQMSAGTVKDSLIRSYQLRHEQDLQQGNQYIAGRFKSLDDKEWKRGFIKEQVVKAGM